jgi:aryl-alcohol dehydrogenase-like predicted oxidoreductase
MQLQLQSRVGLGTAPLSSRRDGPLWWGPQDDARSIATIEAALEAGIDWIDTAPFYGWGLAEELVGRVLSGRASVTVLTKCGTQRGPDGRAFEDASPARVRDGVRASLDRLGMDHVDVVQVHDPDPATPIEATWEALMQLVADVVGGAGLSNHPVALMERARGVGPVTVVQHQFSLLFRDPERDGVLAWCRAHGVPFLAWSPLASGFLAEGFDLAALDPTDLRRGLIWAQAASQERLARIRRALTDIAGERDTTVTAVALGWVVAQPGVAAVVGARTPVEATAAASVAPLDQRAVDRLDEASAP